MDQISISKNGLSETTFQKDFECFVEHVILQCQPGRRRVNFISGKLDAFNLLLKDLSDSSMYDLEGWFGPEIGDLTSQDQTDLWSLMTRAGQVGDWVSFSVDNMSAAEREQAQGGDYMVWESAEMEGTCDFCA